MMNNVQTLLESPAGTLWCGTRQALYRLPPEQSEFVKEKFLPIPVNCLLLDNGRERPWCGTDGGLWHWSGQDWQRVNKLQGGVVHCLVSDAAGTIWAGTRKGLWIRRDQNWKQMEAPSPEKTVRCLLALPEGIYCGTEEGLVILDTDGSQLHLEMQNIRVSCLVQSSKGMFCGTDKGLFRRKPNGQSWLRTKRTEKIKALLVDRGEKLWCATEEGLFRFCEGEWSRVLEASVQCLLEERNGRIQGGTSEGLILLWGGGSEGEIRHPLPREEPPSTPPSLTGSSSESVVRSEDGRGPDTGASGQFTSRHLTSTTKQSSDNPQRLPGWLPFLGLAVLSVGTVLFLRPQPIADSPPISPSPVVKQPAFSPSQVARSSPIEVVQKFFTETSQNGQLPRQFATGHLQRNIGSRTERVITFGNYAGVRNCLERTVKGGADVRCTLLLHKQPPLSVRVNLTSIGSPKIDRIQYYSTRLCSDGRKRAYTYSDTELYRGGNPIARVSDPCLK